MRMHTGGASLSIYGDQTTPPQSRNARIRTSEQLSYTPHYKAELLRLQGNFSLQHRDRETETHPVLDAARKKKKRPPFPAWALVSPTTLLHGLLCQQAFPLAPKDREKKRAPALGSDGMLNEESNSTGDSKGRTRKRNNQVAHKQAHKVAACSRQARPISQGIRKITVSQHKHPQLDKTHAPIRVK